MESILLPYHILFLIGVNPLIAHIALIFLSSLIGRFWVDSGDFSSFLEGRMGLIGPIHNKLD